MSKGKALKSLLSIVFCAAFMFAVFSSPVFKTSKEADLKLNGVTGNMEKLGEKIFSKINNNDDDKSERQIETIDEYVYLGGFPVGLKLYADGVVVVGIEAVDTENGLVNAGEKAGIKVGDIIKKVNNKKVFSNKEVSSIIENSEGNNIEFEIMREDKVFTTVFNSLYSVSECKYKAGLWIRDSSAGIGTVTFCTKDGYFASLGHAVCDIDTKKTLPIAQGESTNVNITGYKRGGNGTPGEIIGFLDDGVTGQVYDNGNIGVYGLFNLLPNTRLLPLGSRSEVKTGPATIFTTLENGQTMEYSIEIKAVDLNAKDNKNLIVKVTDENLLKKSGGIIQGMSGSPIVQNGKIVGAVTHVFLNDSTGGYGIFAETMFKNVKFISELREK